ncbi:MAG: hypothetical protein AAGC99_14205 [Pseudomonadota bacterium]
MLKTAKLASVMLMMGLASACGTNGKVNSLLQLTETETGGLSENERASFGQQIAFAEGGFTTRIHDLAPYVR